MKKAEKQYLKTIFAVVFLVAAAVICHTVARQIYTDNPFADKILTYTRTFIYIGMYIAWGISVSKRVIQIRVRRQLMLVAFLFVFWLLVREFKFRYVLSPDIIRYLWYSYYIPILLIPLIAFFVSLSLGREENYKAPKWTALFIIPTVAFILTVLTNDFHELVFDFPSGLQFRTEENYEYGVTFYIITAWVVVTSLCAYATMLFKSRVPQSKKLAWMPLLPGVIELFYFSLYVTGNPVITKYFDDVAVVFCLIYACFFEGCIRSGLIQTNTDYSGLFNACADIPAQILDTSYNVRYSAASDVFYPENTVRQALESPVITDDGRRIHAISINGGYAVWSEDISELISLKETLEDRHEELQERNAFLQLEYEREREHKTVEEQNRLYDLLQSKTQSRIDTIDLCMQEYKRAANEEEKRRILNRILVLGTFIKRRKDFVLSMEYSNEFPELMLTSALEESYRALRLCDIGGSYFVNTERKTVSGNTLADAYDFFEDVLEEVFDRVKYINFRLARIDGKMRVSVLTDVTSKSSINKKYPSALINNDEGNEYMLLLEGGEGID